MRIRGYGYEIVGDRSHITYNLLPIAYYLVPERKLFFLPVFASDKPVLNKTGLGIFNIFLRFNPFLIKLD